MKHYKPENTLHLILVITLYVTKCKAVLEFMAGFLELIYNLTSVYY